MKTVLVPDLLQARAVSEPERIAHAVDDGGSLTYGAWERRSNALARGLAEMGVRPGDRVGLYFENSDWVDFAVAYMGTVKAGAVAVPLSSRFAGPELLSVLDRAGVEGVIVGSERPRAPGWHMSVTELLEGRYSDDAVQACITPADLAEILYTSGTTGLPKGVACAHAHIVRPFTERGDWPPSWWRACSGGLYLHALSVSTAGGQLRLLEPLMPERMTTLALPVFDADRFCRLAAENQAAVVQMVPSMALTILQTQAYRRYDVSCVRVVELGCAPLPASVLPELSAAFPGAHLVNMYSLSETRYTGTAMVHDGSHPGSVGLPFGGSDVRVTDPAGRPVATRAIGEVRLRRPGLKPQHYFGDAKASAEVFGSGWTRTGDAGYLDEDGYLYVVDRIKDVITKGGHNVSSVMVESALLEHPDVVEAAVIGVPNPLLGEEVVAALVARGLVDGDELRAFLRTRLGAHEIPSRFIPVPDLPRNRSGKVLKRELRRRVETYEGGTAMRGADSGDASLAGIWASVLDRNSVNPDDDFFDLGGDSIQASQVTARVLNTLGVELPVTAVFENRTLAALSAVVDDLMRTGVPAIPPPIPRLPRPKPPASSSSRDL